MKKLHKYYGFPNPINADEQGLLAVGGDLIPERLLAAYNSGIFPWYEEGQPILWWSPDPRMVLFPEKLHISKSMRRLFRQKKFKITTNQNFEDVIQNCAAMNRKGQHGTWITEDMISAYAKLHELGIAQSVEVWEEGKLIGGLYGVYLKEKQVFCGESMFSKTSDASKYGFISLVNKLKSENIKLIDCQVYSEHLERLGGEEIARDRFLKFL